MIIIHYLCTRINFYIDMTYREIVYMILDEVKLTSDDSIINEDHVMFLLNTYRPFILKQYYDTQKELDIPDFDYQEICIDLEQVDSMTGEPCEEGSYLRSIQKIPKLLGLGTVTVSPLDYYSGVYLTYVSRNRMRFVGNNKYLKNFIYCSLGPDKHLYVKINNPQASLLEKLKMTAIFDDASEADKLKCCDEDADPNASCDPLDSTFALEDHLVPQVMELVLKSVLGAAYRPQDDINNDSDDLSDLHNFIAKNVKSDLAKQISN